MEPLGSSYFFHITARCDMGKYILCCLGVLALSLPARAGELDNEPSSVRSATVSAKAAAPVLAKAVTGSELDKEAPQQTWRCCRCGGGCGYRCGGGFCCRSFVCCYPAY